MQNSLFYNLEKKNWRVYWQPKPFPPPNQCVFVTLKLLLEIIMWQTKQQAMKCNMSSNFSHRKIHNNPPVAGSRRIIETKRMLEVTRIHSDAPHTNIIRIQSKRLFYYPSPVQRATLHTKKKTYLPPNIAILVVLLHSKNARAGAREKITMGKTLSNLLNNVFKCSAGKCIWVQIMCIG